MRISFLLTWTAVLLLPLFLAAQAATEWRDPLADRMTGTWKLEGQVIGQAAHHEVRVDWVLNHQFLRLLEKTAASAPNTERRYEAFWFLGYDQISERYVLHLMDVFGARFSESLGYGTREGNPYNLSVESGKRHLAMADGTEGQERQMGSVRGPEAYENRDPLTRTTLTTRSMSAMAIYR